MPINIKLVLKTPSAAKTILDKATSTSTTSAIKKAKLANPASISAANIVKTTILAKPTKISFPSTIKIDAIKTSIIKATIPNIPKNINTAALVSSAIKTGAINITLPNIPTNINLALQAGSTIKTSVIKVTISNIPVNIDAVLLAPSANLPISKLFIMHYSTYNSKAQLIYINSYIAAILLLASCIDNYKVSNIVQESI